MKLFVKPFYLLIVDSTNFGLNFFDKRDIWHFWNIKMWLLLVICNNYYLSLVSLFFIPTLLRKRACAPWFLLLVSYWLRNSAIDERWACSCAPSLLVGGSPFPLSLGDHVQRSWPARHSPAHHPPQGDSWRSLFLPATSHVFSSFFILTVGMRKYRGHLRRGDIASACTPLFFRSPCLVLFFSFSEP